MGAACRSGQAAPAGHLGRTAHRPLQDVPTLRELGYDVVVDAPNGIGAPKGLDPAVAAKLRDAFRQAANSPEFKAVIDKLDAPLLALDGPDYEKYVHTVYQKETVLIDKLKAARADEELSGTVARKAPTRQGGRALSRQPPLMKATMSRTDSPLSHLHPNDNVLVAKTALALGQEISELGVRNHRSAHWRRRHHVLLQPRHVRRRRSEIP